MVSPARRKNQCAVKHVPVEGAVHRVTRDVDLAVTGSDGAAGVLTETMRHVRQVEKGCQLGTLAVTMIEILSFGRTMISLAAAMRWPSTDDRSWKYAISLEVEHEARKSSKAAAGNSFRVLIFLKQIKFSQETTAGCTPWRRPPRLRWSRSASGRAGSA